MWICFNDGFVSAVQDPFNPNGLRVRGRRAEIMRALFPEHRILMNSSSDYRYRVSISKAEFVQIISRRLSEISHENFKESVEDKELQELYLNFYLLHSAYQEGEAV